MVLTKKSHGRYRWLPLLKKLYINILENQFTYRIIHFYKLFEFVLIDISFYPLPRYYVCNSINSVFLPFSIDKQILPFLSIFCAFFCRNTSRWTRIRVNINPIWHFKENCLHSNVYIGRFTSHQIIYHTYPLSIESKPKWKNLKIFIYLCVVYSYTFLYVDILWVLTYTFRITNFKKHHGIDRRTKYKIDETNNSLKIP